MVNLRLKKGQMAYQELVLIVFSILFVAILIFFSGTYVSSSKTELSQIAPDLNYDFPAVFVHSFLLMELDSDDKKKFDKKYGINYVKDLFWINSEIAKNLTKKYRLEYISMNRDVDSNSNDIFDYYERFSGESLNIGDSLLFDFDLSYSDLPNYDKLLSNNNYGFYLKNIDGNYVFIYFKSSVYSSRNEYNTNYDTQSSVDGFS